MQVEPLTATIGAEIGGVDLVAPLSDDQVAEIRAALLAWKVIFFRDQERLDRASHIAFGRRFGDLEVHPLTPEDQAEPEIFVLPSDGRRIEFASFTAGDVPRSLVFAPATAETRRAGVAGDLFVIAIRGGTWPINEVLRVSGPFEELVRPR